MNVEKFLPGLEEALAYGGGTHTILDVLDQIQRGEAQIWANEEACIITEVHAYPRAKVLHFWLTTGALDAVLALEDEALAWGREQGCTSATLAGRRGWERVLASHGWAPALSYMRRGIGDG